MNKQIKLMPKSLLLFLILFFSLSTIEANDDRFHRVPAQYGDNINKLLARYDLENHDCNFTKFYSLNKLKKNSRLVENKKYYIPILIKKYNGKSIRTSLDLEGWEQPFRIKRFNEKMKDEGLRSSTIPRSRIIWVPYHELNCTGGKKPSKSEKTIAKKENKPKKKAEKEEDRKKANDKVESKVLTSQSKISGYRKFPIFGKKNAYIPLVDDKLRGKVFYVVSGHGGPDVGAVGKWKNKQLCEDEYAYDVSLRLARQLLQHGALVYMITRDPDDGLRSDKYLPCDKDEYCWGNYKIPRSQKSRLYQRSDAINELYERHRKQGLTEQTTIVIHIDSRNTKESTDVFFYYFPGSSKGKKTAQKIHSTLRDKYKKYRKGGRYDGTVTARDLHMLREPKTNSVFIELGNIRNKYDQQRFILEANREALAKWLFEGLIK